jgi:hypothetical protein
MEIALRHMSAAEMTALSSALLGEHRKDFESIAEVKPLVRMVQTAHEGLLVAEPAAVDAAGAAQAIASEQRAVDLRHDHALRALYYALSARAEYLQAQETTDQPEVERILRVRNVMVPGGLGGTQVSYSAEVGNTVRADEQRRNDTDTREVLEHTHLEKKVTGHNVVDTWVEIGKRLGELEQQKNTAAPVTHAATGRTSLAARNDWIGVIGAVMGVLEHATTPQEAVERVRSAITAAAERAAERAATHRKAGSVRPPADGKPDGGTPAAG